MDAIFLHTLTVGLLAGKIYERIPTVISVDATPLNYDEVGEAYGHRKQPRFLESIKQRLTRNVLGKARGYVAWSDWAKDSLVKDYDVDADAVRVLAPGADLSKFKFPERCRAPGAKVRILFVGGDFQRKGGDLLLEVFRTRLRGRAELHLVTGAPVEPEEDVHVHRDLKPNSEGLLEQFREADIFALPTRADCLAVVLGEAMGASLPIVTTAIGAHAEAVESGLNGFIVSDSADSLGDALETLIDNPALLRQMGEAGRQRAEERFDASKNAKALIEFVESCAN